VSEPARGRAGEDPPPFGGSWRALYLAVASTLAVLIALFYLFAKAFE
jgi:hypothetical protein